MKTLRIKRLKKGKKKKFFYALIFILISALNINAQNLTLVDLQDILNKSNWEEVNQFLLNKNWEYFSFKTEIITQLKTITWTYNKSNSDTPEAWLLVYVNNGIPIKIDYSVSNTQPFTIIEKSMDANGYKQDNSKVEDDEVISKYSNSKFTIKITTEVSKNNYDSISSNEDSTAYYNFLFYNKSSTIEVNNGKKETFDIVNDVIVKIEYTLINGKIEGEYIIYYYANIRDRNINYYPDSRIKRIGYFLNGVANGNFKEYDIDGNLSSEYFKKNGKTNGTMKEYYQNGHLKAESNFIDDVQEGAVIEYSENGLVNARYTCKDNMINGIYASFIENKKDEEKEFINGTLTGKYRKYYYNSNGDLFQILRGNYLNGKPNGKWQLEEFATEGRVRIISLFNYSGGLRNGGFLLVELDRLLVGNYLDDKLDGELRIYVNSEQMRLESINSTDTANMRLIIIEYFNSGQRNGEWKYYDLKGSLIYSEKYKDGILKK